MSGHDVDHFGLPSDEIDPVVRDINLAVDQAMLEHKRAGLPIVVADEHGHPVWVPAEEIDVTPFDAVEPQPPSEHDR